MAQLIKQSPESKLITRIGGQPCAPADVEWPQCRTCGGNMQFLAQIALPETDLADLNQRQQVLLLFQCANDPGMCDDWDPDAGGNAALLVAPTENVLSAPEGETSLPAESRVVLESYDSSLTEESPDDNYVSSFEQDADVLGKIGGQPAWIQGDETPTCSCGAAMRFVAQLEERGGGGGINFGDMGVGYAFICPACSESAKFLWQCS